MRSYLVTEERTDGQIWAMLKSALFEDEDVVIVEGGSRSEAVSMARSLLSRRQQPVALVLNADTLDERVIAEQRSDLEALLDIVVVADLWCVALFVPEIEGLFFHDLRVAQRIFKVELTAREKARARTEPRQLLLELAERRGWGSEVQRRFLRAMSVTERRALRTHPTIAQVLGFQARRRRSSAA